MFPNAIDTKKVEKSAFLYSRGILFDIFPYFAHNIKDKFAYSIDISLILYYNLRENNGGKEMRSFNYSAFKEQKWDSDILGLIAAIYKEAGKQEQYLKQRPQEMEKLIEIAKIQSTEASNAIEGIVTTSTRIKQLVEEKTTPRNRDEQEIAGYRDVLNVIHESFDAIPITHNYILQLHKMLYSHMNNPLAGRTKSVQNYISAAYPDGHTEILFTPLASYETSEALDRICEEYNRVIGNLEVEPLIIIPIFIHDFLCIHPFNDGNGRMSRLLTTLLLYQNGFYIGKYISLEAKISKNKDLYYSALSQSQTGWHEGKEDALPFIKYILGTILASYKDFEERTFLVQEKLPALEMVRMASKSKIGRFNKQDIRELCPTLSDSSIEGALRKLVAAGELKKEGKGKSTCYFRLN
jgi:Fic family protein